MTFLDQTRSAKGPAWQRIHLFTPQIKVQSCESIYVNVRNVYV